MVIGLFSQIRTFMVHEDSFLEEVKEIDSLMKEIKQLFEEL